MNLRGHDENVKENVCLTSELAMCHLLSVLKAVKSSVSWGIEIET